MKNKSIVVSLVSVCLVTAGGARAEEKTQAMPSVSSEEVGTAPVPATDVKPPVPVAETSTDSVPAPVKVTCHDSGGMAQEPTEALSAFYRPQQSSVTATSDKITVDAASGAMVVNGTHYTLRSMEFPKTLVIALGDDAYVAEVLFLHDAPDGSQAVLVVPVRIGGANLGMEKILSGATTQMIDPNDFLPAARQYTPTGRVFGEDCSAQQSTQYFVMVSPVEASAQQIEKLKAVSP